MAWTGRGGSGGRPRMRPTGCLMLVLVVILVLLILSLMFGGFRMGHTAAAGPAAAGEAAVLAVPPG
jgi:flagellar basal body-associated protein FliL